MITLLLAVVVISTYAYVLQTIIKDFIEETKGE